MLPEIEAESSEPQSNIDAEQWLSRYGDDLFRFAMLRLRDRQLAEEVVQDTFVSAYCSRQRFEGRSSEKTWLIGILKRKIFAHLRRLYSQRPAVDDPTERRRAFRADGHWDPQSGLTPGDWGDPAQLLNRRSLRDALHQCILRLPPRFGDVFVLREFEELDTAEICRMLGITPENCWVILHRVRMKLRQCLEHAGFGPEETGRR